MRALFGSFRAELFGCLLVVAALSLLFPICYVRPVLNEALLQEAYDRLAHEAVLVEALLEFQGEKQDKKAVLAAVARADMRLTLLDAEGVVLADTGVQDSDLSDNHADRPEILDALQNGSGFAARFSNTLQQELVYAAFRLGDNTILRLATPFAGVRQRTNAQIGGFLLTAGILVALSLLLAWSFSRRLGKSLAGMARLVEGIARGNFARRLRYVPGREFRPLADAVNHMAQSLEDFVRTEADQAAQLNAILDTMAEGVLVLGPKGRIRRVNKAFTVAFSSVRHAEGAQIIEAVPCPELQEAVTSLLNEPDAYGQNRSLRITLEEKTVFFVLLARPTKEAADSLGLVAVFHDITELMRLETVRRDFVANVSHELRTPLTAVQGYAETLADMDDMPEQGRHFAAVIHKHSCFISGMVNELLTLSRLENDNFRLDVKSVNPREPLRAAAHMLSGALSEKKLSLEESFADGLLVAADPRHLEQVFRNLLENACRYAPEGSEIGVGAFARSNEALFAVSDQGCGIPLADKDRIFERFYRVEKHRGGGSGLGLAICKHIIECLNGRIWVESPSSGASTTFYFTIPLADKSAL
ncbi:MAG: PAS domain-containing sensor histidine kinase [Desulfovibrio sp.]|nr:PAS domain-containing sensor histidine kinase [Desulfovibrio sp.]